MIRRWPLLLVVALLGSGCDCPVGYFPSPAGRCTRPSVRCDFGSGLDPKGRCVSTGAFGPVGGPDALFATLQRTTCDGFNRCLVVEGLAPIDCDIDTEALELDDLCTLDVALARACIDELDEARCNGPVLDQPEVCRRVITCSGVSRD